MDKARITPQQLAFVFNAYDDCVASIDEQLGRLFDELERRKALDRTWVILVSDHGESFGEHPGVFLHGSSLYRTELHVPLVVIPPPGIRIKPVVAETVSLRNIAATIVDIAGLGTDISFPGVSLARFWREKPSSPLESESVEGALAELVPNETLGGQTPDSTHRPWPLAALTEGGWSYIRREGEVREELYHLGEDPREQHDVAASAGARSRLDRMREFLSRMTLGPLTPDRFNPNTVEIGASHSLLLAWVYSRPQATRRLRLACHRDIARSRPTTRAGSWIVWRDSNRLSRPRPFAKPLRSPARRILDAAH